MAARRRKKAAALKKAGVDEDSDEWRAAIAEIDAEAQAQRDTIEASMAAAIEAKLAAAELPDTACMTHPSMAPMSSGLRSTALVLGASQKRSQSRADAP